MDYAEKLKDPKWKDKRLEILKRDGYLCLCCHFNHKVQPYKLHVHHLRYLPNREPWEYRDEDLITLCYDCHKMAHMLPERRNNQIEIEKYFCDKFKMNYSNWEVLINGDIKKAREINKNHPNRYDPWQEEKYTEDDIEQFENFIEMYGKYEYIDFYGKRKYEEMCKEAS